MVIQQIHYKVWGGAVGLEQKHTKVNLSSCHFQVFLVSLENYLRILLCTGKNTCRVQALCEDSQVSIYVVRFVQIMLKNRGRFWWPEDALDIDLNVTTSLFDRGPTHVNNFMIFKFWLLGTNSRQGTTRVVPCANSRGQVVANILRCERQLKLWLHQLNPPNVQYWSVTT